MATPTRIALAQMATEIRLMNKASPALWRVTAGVPAAAVILLATCRAHSRALVSLSGNSEPSLGEEPIARGPNLPNASEDK